MESFEKSLSFFFFFNYFHCTERGISERDSEEVVVLESGGLCAREKKKKMRMLDIL